ncbi:MAG: hypothetical protein Q9180_001842 [Flavoplaca navasiana]
MRNLGARLSMSSIEDFEEGRREGSSTASEHNASPTPVEDGQGDTDTPPIEFRTNMFTATRTRQQYESPPCSILTTFAIRRPENDMAAVSCITKRVTKEIGKLASVRIGREKHVDSLKAERLDRPAD